MPTSVILLLVCCALTGFTCILIGRNYPSLTRLEEEYQAGADDERKKWDLVNGIYEQPEEEERSPADTFEYMFNKDAPRPQAVRVMPPPPAPTQVIEEADPQPVPGPKPTPGKPPPPAPKLLDEPEDDNDEEAVSTFFSELAQDHCTACQDEAQGACTCADYCGHRACQGWNTSTFQAVRSEEAGEVDRLCARMDRETEAFIIQMKADDSRYRASKLAQEARQHYHAEVIQRSEEPDTETMRAITA